MNTQTAVKEYLAARAAAEAAAEAKATAEQVLKEAFAKAGVTSGIDQAEGVKVAVVQGERPNYDADLLARLSDDGVIDMDTYIAITKVTVDGKAFKAAVEIGVLDRAIAEKVTTMTPYEQIRVSKV